MTRHGEKGIVFSLSDSVEKTSLPSLDHTYAPKVTSETKMNEMLVCLRTLLLTLTLIVCDGSSKADIKIESVLIFFGEGWGFSCLIETGENPVKHKSRRWEEPSRRHPT